MVIVPAPETPPDNAVTSPAVKSKVDAPANDIVVAALEGFNVKAPVVVNALLPVFAEIVTESAVIVIAPEPDEISKSLCAYVPVPTLIVTALLVVEIAPATVVPVLPFVKLNPP